MPVEESETAEGETDPNLDTRAITAEEAGGLLYMAVFAHDGGLPDYQPQEGPAPTSIDQYVDPVKDLLNNLGLNLPIGLTLPTITTPDLSLVLNTIDAIRQLLPRIVLPNLPLPNLGTLINGLPIKLPDLGAITLPDVNQIIDMVRDLVEQRLLPGVCPVQEDSTDHMLGQTPPRRPIPVRRHRDRPSRRSSPPPAVRESAGPDWADDAVLGRLVAVAQQSDRCRPDHSGRGRGGVHRPDRWHQDHRWLQRLRDQHGPFIGGVAHIWPTRSRRPRVMSASSRTLARPAAFLTTTV